MLLLPDYRKIKDKYCLSYFGHCADYLVQLKYLRPLIKEKYPGLQIFIICRQEDAHIFKQESDVIFVDFIASKNFYGCINDIRCNMRDHPVELLIKDLIAPTFETTIKIPTLAYISNRTFLPTKKLKDDELTLVKNKIKRVCEVSDNFTEQVDWVVGVESEILFEAAFKGLKTSLIPSGIGTNFYKSLFPRGEIFSL